MHEFLNWTNKHPLLYWIGCIALSLMLIAVQSQAVDGKRFFLLPIYSLNPRDWFYSAVLVFREFPWLATAVLVVPLCGVAFAIIARRDKA